MISINNHTKISIIIATYNAGHYIENAIKSIIQQGYPCIEVVIIDGMSTDDTISIISRYNKYISYWKSESDNGIYDAWNKGLEISKGDWIMFLGSDDVLLPNALNSYSSFIKSLDNDVEFISSKIQYTDRSMDPYRVMGWQWEWPKFQREMTVAHPGSLHSKKLFNKYGKYNTKYKIVGDYELLLRARNNLKTAFMDEITVMFREGGASDSYAAINEAFKASVTTGKSPLYKSLLYTSLVYLKFFIRKSLRKANLNLYLRK